MKMARASIKGKDGKIYSVNVEASSLYDAAEQCVRRVCRFWQFDPQALITVEADGQRWLVSQDKMHAKRKKLGIQQFGPQRDFNIR
jgi:hypothetical protein